MIQINNSLVSELLLEKKFVCDLSACKGACCVEGDEGAPLESSEIEEIEKNLDGIKPFLRKEGLKSIEKLGVYKIDKEGDFVTPLVEGEECAYVTFDKNGIAKCGIEQAYNAGKSTFKKPISCHLYPVRISKVGSYDALNYSKWQICEPACACGDELNVKVFRFLKDALIRKYDEQWYAELEEADKLLEKIKKSK